MCLSCLIIGLSLTSLHSPGLLLLSYLHCTGAITHMYRRTLFILMCCCGLISLVLFAISIALGLHNKMDKSPAHRKFKALKPLDCRSLSYSACMSVNDGIFHNPHYANLNKLKDSIDFQPYMLSNATHTPKKPRGGSPWMFWITANQTGAPKRIVQND